VCVIGETIIDEWVDVTLTNRSTQSRCVAGLETARAKQIGGVGIIALHLSQFVSEVHCFTNGLTADLPPNIHVTNLSSGQLVETRFVDRDSGRAVFKSKSVSLSDVPPDSVPAFDDYDLVLIADFGHGLLDSTAINRRIAETERAFVGAMAFWGEDALPYTGRMMIPLVIPGLAHAFPEGAESLHYSSCEFHTRVTEMKVITHHESPDNTLILIEVPVLPGAAKCFSANTIEYALEHNLFAEEGISSAVRSGVRNLLRLRRSR
jgi:hypothetical protein